MSRKSYRRYQAETFAVEGARALAYLAAAILPLFEASVLFAPGLTSRRWWVLPLAATVVVVVALARGLYAAGSLRSLAVRVRSGREVLVVVADFLDSVDQFRDASIVFGVNDQFSVSELKSNSVHAGFLRKYFPDHDAEQNQDLMDLALRQSAPVPAAQAAACESEERPRHPAGTVVCLPFDADAYGAPRNAFLLANSSRRRHGFSGDGQTAQMIRRIWEYHHEHRVVTDQILFSLVGTGHSGDMSKMASAFHIIDEYFRHLEMASPVRVARLVVSILPEAVMRAEVDLRAVHEYLTARAALHRALI
jgi:hypothetical protein